MKVLSCLFLIILPCAVLAQRKPDHLHLSGTVLGYHYEPKGFFKKEQVEIQGSLSNVKITATNQSGKEIATTITDNGGSFHVYIPIESTIKLTYNKQGYAVSSINFNLASVSENMAKTGLILENIELILNDNQTEFPIDNGVPFASVNYGSSNIFSVKPIEFDKKERLFKEIENSTPVNLLTRSVKKNRNKNLEPNTTEVVEENVLSGSPDNQNPKRYRNNETVETTEEVSNSLEKKIQILKSGQFGNIEQWKDLTVEDLSTREDEINAAWDQLAKDKLLAATEEDFIIIEAREELLRSAERELEAARAYIEEQDGKLNAQRRFMFVLIALLLLMGGFVFYLIRSIREKNRLNTELDKKNKKILSSINYARRIQNSVLLRDDEIKAILPNSFVFYQPLDVVSGDFYWFTEMNGKVIVAAVDCTGHGVPGAFMSLIGNTLMNQIINEKKILQPSKILKLLHEGIVRSLNQAEDVDASQDGMDMSICSIDKASGEMIFAGAVNPIYIVENGEVKEISADIFGIGGLMTRKKNREFNYQDQVFNLSKGTNIYLFSDGYMDQFGGEKNEKFNVPRFRELLKKIHQEPMAAQRNEFFKALENWKGNKEQVDDILVIGIQI